MELNATLIIWALSINACLAFTFACWVYSDAKRNRRSSIQWSIFSFLIGSIFGAPNGFLCYYVYYQAVERSRIRIIWATLCAVFSIPGFVAFYTYDDCKSRNMVPALWSLLAFIFAMAAFFPWLIFQLFYILIRRPASGATSTVDTIKERYEKAGLLEPSDDMLLRVENLKKYFPVQKGVLSRVIGHVKAVDDITLFVKSGETLGLVGESGCGKTTLGRTILRLIQPTSGRVIFEGLGLEQLSESEQRVMRKEMQIIFQDPFGSLNPRMTVENIVGEPMTVHKLAEGKTRREKVKELLNRVGLSEEHLERYPHEFSGGQRQRIGIARAIALNPRFIVCDEPVSALDVSIQAQIVNLLRDLQQEFGLSYLFIAHDLRIVEHISDRVAVMYLGKIVEHASSEELYRNPRHPYTVALMSAIPVPDPEHKRNRIILPGDVPSPIDPPTGCSFHPRCFSAKPICSETTPELIEHDPGHYFACHNPVPAK